MGHALSDPSAGQLSVNADGSYSFAPTATDAPPVLGTATVTLRF